MRRALAILTVVVLATGCAEEPAKGGLTFEQQQRKKMQAELDRIQSQINRNLQNNIENGQKAIKAAQPRIRR